MTFRLAIVMDDIESIKPYKDTSFAIALAAQERGMHVACIEPHTLSLKNTACYGMARAVRLYDRSENWVEAGPAEERPLTEYNAVLMRQDPPVTKRFLHACYMLRMAEKQGVPVWNRPQALIDYNEKMLALDWPHLCPETHIGADYESLRAFWKEHGDIILKPLDAMGGSGVFFIGRDDVNFDVIWESSTQAGTYPVIVQPFLPAIAEGDKRIVIIGGKVFPHALVRTPKSGSIRGNMAAGGTTEVRPLTAEENAMAEEIAAELPARGILLAGIDVIGDRLIEVNITSPTGLRQIAKATGVDLVGMIVDRVMKHKA